MKRMTCCCCGEAAFGKQWWNRDTGFSLCVSCADRQEKKESPEFMKLSYGIRGVHYACVPKPEKSMSKPKGLEPTTPWKTFFRALSNQFPDSNMSDDYGGNIYLKGGIVPKGNLIIITPDYDDFNGRATLIGMYDLIKYEFGGDETVTAPVIVIGRNQLEYPDKYVPKIRRAVEEQITAFLYRKELVAKLGWKA